MQKRQPSLGNLLWKICLLRQIDLLSSEYCQFTGRNRLRTGSQGAYIVAGSDENPDVILVASGSEVATLVAGTELLRKDGVKVRIVSAPSEGLFRNQPKEYQEAILPADAKIFGMTAGLPVTLQGLVGCHGKVWGLESFGFSAPYKVLDEKLGFTAENVYNQVKAML